MEKEIIEKIIDSLCDRGGFDDWPVQCRNCKHFEEDKNYKGEGKCNNDGRYTREHRVCNLLDTDEKRRNAKMRR